MCCTRRGAGNRLSKPLGSTAPHICLIFKSLDTSGEPLGCTALRICLIVESLHTNGSQHAATAGPCAAPCANGENVQAINTTGSPCNVGHVLTMSLDLPIVITPKRLGLRFGIWLLCDCFMDQYWPPCEDTRPQSRCVSSQHPWIRRQSFLTLTSSNPSPPNESPRGSPHREAWWLTMFDPHVYSF